MGEAVQQRSVEALRTEDLGPLIEGQVGGDQDGAPLVALAEDLEEQFSPVGDRGTKPSSSTISRPRRDSCRCRLSSRLSPRASSGPLHPVFTGATPQRGSPAGVLRRPGAAGPPGLPHGRGVRRSWLETALFPAPAGNPPIRSSAGWLENPVYLRPAGRYTFGIPARGAAG